jgi:protein-L-isoaspartate(D-aspartate) O-methyltransferase
VSNETRQRLAMVEEQIAARGVTSPAVLTAMRVVARHAFVPPALARHAYEDRPLPVGSEQTISQPYVVAAMTELAQVTPTSRVLEIGTGSGYQTAVLAEIARQVFSVEIVEPLAQHAAEVLTRLGYGDRVQLRVGDGYRGWPEEAPFDAILVTAAPPVVPAALVDQLALNGRLVIPVGTDDQDLVVIQRTASGLRTERMFPVRFVPMTGGLSV